MVLTLVQLGPYNRSSTCFKLSKNVKCKTVSGGSAGNAIIQLFKYIFFIKGKYFSIIFQFQLLMNKNIKNNVSTKM